MTISLNFKTTSSHLHPLQVKNCDSILRFLVDEDDNGKFRPERVQSGVSLLFVPLVTIRPEDSGAARNATEFQH